jgi:ribosome biogenesis GTPase
VSSRERYGWSPFFEQQAASLDRHDLAFSRVVEAQRGMYRVDGDVAGWAEVSGRYRHEALNAAAFPTVGDWVGVQDGIIHARLERRSTLSRAAAGRAPDEQVVAANVDTIFLVTAVPQDLNTRRLERYLTMVWDAGALPVVVVNKADLCADPAAACDTVRARLPLIDVVAVSAVSAPGLEALTPYLGAAQTVALLGSSGVGKSTIVNGLLGDERLRVGAISDTDGRGQHTTTARHLVPLPGGALLIDTPGMRELQPWGDESSVEAAFDDIATLAADCRFTDCAHGSEPGCAVLAAVADGQLDPDRLANFQRLGREAAHQARKHDQSAAAELKRRWKQIHKATRAMYRDRDRR